MDLEKPELKAKKMVTTWWDLVDHYLLAVMFAVSVASFGVQVIQDHLICIPAVRCSDLVRNDSVVRKWTELSNMLDICYESRYFAVLTTMPDRRQYDYVDNECYKKMDLFSAYYSLIFLVETVTLLAISNFWLKCPNSANALAHCQHLLSEFIKGEISAGHEESEEAQQENRKKQRELTKRMRIFEAGYSQRITKFNLSSLTGQYRLRGVVGSLFTIVLLAVNALYYSLSTGWTWCHLDSPVAFSAKQRFFQCTRSMGAYFHVSSILLIFLLSLHLIFVLGSFLWSVTGERSGPTYKISTPVPGDFYFRGDAAFLFHFILSSNYGRFTRYTYEEMKERESQGEGEASTPLDPIG